MRQVPKQHHNENLTFNYNPTWILAKVLYQGSVHYRALRLVSQKVNKSAEKFMAIFAAVINMYQLPTIHALKFLS